MRLWRCFRSPAEETLSVVIMVTRQALCSLVSQNRLKSCCQSGFSLIQTNAQRELLEVCVFVCAWVYVLVCVCFSLTLHSKNTPQLFLFCSHLKSTTDFLIISCLSGTLTLCSSSVCVCVCVCISHRSPRHLPNTDTVYKVFMNHVTYEE